MAYLVVVLKSPWCLESSKNTSRKCHSGDQVMRNITKKQRSLDSIQSNTHSIASHSKCVQQDKKRTTL